MSGRLHILFDQALELSGVKAAGLVGPNRPGEVATRSAGIDEVALSPVWRHFADTLEVGAHYRMPAQEMRWIFEHVLVYCLRRADGVMLALIVGREPGAGFDDAAAERLFEDFRKTRDA